MTDDCHSDDFRRALEKSGFLHEPLTVSEELSYENLTANGKVIEAIMPVKGSWELVLVNDTGVRATGSPDDPDYATYGNFHIDIPVNVTDSETGYNRISFMVYPDCEGMGVTNINLNIPGVSHLINLKNRQWNHCTLEADPKVLGNLENIRISSTSRGKDLTYSDKAVYKIEKLALEKISNPYKDHGWEPDKNIISYSTTGYLTGFEKTAIASGSRNADRFRLIARNGRTAYRGKAVKSETSIGNYRILDFSDFNKKGEYAIDYDGTRTPYFKIGNNVWNEAKWKVLNYIFCQRCGYNVPGIHNTCHTDLYSRHNGVSIPYSGGWHDAGDLSQQTLQTGDVTYALFEAYARYKDEEPVLAARLKEEARWGLEFILKNRFGDGYRASSMGLLHWTDGVVGSKDDIYTVRVQNLPFDNFLYSGYEAYAALTLKKEDPKTFDYLVKVAEEDFVFAMEEYQKNGYAGFIQPYEHTYNTSRSQFMATVSWAASQLYLLTGEKHYAEKAEEFIEYVLECQQTEPIGEDKVTGFFWRDTTKKSIVHYIHQSRDQFYMMALESLCRTQPENINRSRWMDSMKIYGEYIKTIFKHTYPYNMMPSGVYHIDEPSDTEAFYALHLFPPADAKERYDTQIKKGVKLTDEFYIKRFPIWFNIFNGNNAIILSTAKAAAICSNMFNDPQLKQMALDQLYWISGKNPFNQSMIYGEGANFPPLDSFSSGDIVGAMPVGIKTVGDEDVPEWPEINNACYKEVWVTTAGKWLSLLSEL
ncbi:MAG: glycoside hydrolase family 9 protein [Bacteroidales bacterium]|nr:glycoside hydrolase family 9 protein [Bacteroidales bacterium]